jgi:hypothetical protein
MIDFVSEYDRSAYFPGLVEICKGEAGKPLFLLVKNGTATMEDKAVTEKGTVIPPEFNQLPRPIGDALPNAELVMKWIENEDEGLYLDLLTYLRRFSYLDELQLCLAAHYTFLTYLHDHPGISYCPYILYYAVPERGKSRAGKALSYVCFRGFHSVDLREPVIFRFTENLHGTLFLDLMNLWKKAEKNHCEDILLTRYEKGVQCARVLYPEKGPFHDTVYFDTYGPTIIATNEPLHNILGTRCLPITMPNAPGNYENPKPEYALGLRARLTAWRAKYLSVALPEVTPIDGISGRLWDISRPLFQISKLIDPSYMVLLERAIFAIAGDKSAEKRGTIEGKLVEIIHDLSKEYGLSKLPEWCLKTSEITGKYNEGRSADRHVSASWIGLRLTGLSLRKRQINGRSEYIITQADYRALLAQYGLSSEPGYSAVVIAPKSNGSTNTLPGKVPSFQTVMGEVGGCRVLREPLSYQKESFEERAAIMEMEGGLDRKEAAEKAANEDIPF